MEMEGKGEGKGAAESSDIPSFLFVNPFPFSWPSLSDRPHCMSMTELTLEFEMSQSLHMSRRWEKICKDSAEYAPNHVLAAILSM